MVLTHLRVAAFPRVGDPLSPPSHTHTPCPDTRAIRSQTLRTPGQCFWGQEVVISHADTLGVVEGTRSTKIPPRRQERKAGPLPRAQPARGWSLGSRPRSAYVGGVCVGSRPRAYAHARGRFAGPDARPASRAGRWWRARGCRSWCGATSWRSPPRWPSCCCRAWWCGASAAWRRTSRERCSDGRAGGQAGRGGARGPGGAAGGPGQASGAWAACVRGAGSLLEPDLRPPTLLSQAGLAGCVREQCVTRRPGRLVDWGPRREERVIVGWSPSRGAMKVRRGDRGWEERLGPSLLEGGKPQAKLSKVGRGRGCTRRGRRSGGRGTPGIYVQLRLRSSEWRRSGTRGGIMACDKVYMPGNKSERE